MILTIIDLRVLFDSKLSFKYHVENIVSAAYKTLGFMIRNGRYLHNVDTLSILYREFINDREPRDQKCMQPNIHNWQ